VAGKTEKTPSAEQKQKPCTPNNYELGDTDMTKRNADREREKAEKEAHRQVVIWGFWQWI